MNLTRIQPEQGGLSSLDVLNFIEKVKENNVELHSFIFSRDNKVLAEGYYSPYTSQTLQTVYSLSKSFTSFAVGCAIDDKLLKLDDKVVSFFPDIKYEDKSGFMKEMTIKNLLSMSTGQEIEPDFEAECLTREFLNIAVLHKPGKVFKYNTAATYMCSAILKRIGIDLEEYLEKRLLIPLEITGLRWFRSKEGICTAGYGFSLIPECIIKFGTLLLNKGIWNNIRLISEEYIDMATSKIISNSPDDGINDSSDWTVGYGFQFWQSRNNSYRGDGMHGQLCIITPDKKTVFAATAYNSDIQIIITHYYEYILKKYNVSPLPADKINYEKLLETTANLVIPRTEPVPADISGFEGETITSGNYTVKFKKDHTELILNNNVYLFYPKMKRFSAKSPVLKRFAPVYFDSTEVVTQLSYETDKIILDLDFTELLVFLRFTITKKDDGFIIEAYSKQPDRKYIKIEI